MKKVFNSFIENKDIYKWLFGIIAVIIIPLLVGLLLNIPLGKFTIGSEDSWVSFNGSYIGGITGGIVAYFIAKMQIDEMRKQEQKKLDEQYLRTYRIIFKKIDAIYISLKAEYSLGPIFYAMKEINNYHYIEKFNENNNNKIIKSYIEHLESIGTELSQIVQKKEELESITREYIPYEFLEKYDEMIFKLKILETLVGNFLRRHKIDTRITPMKFNSEETIEVVKKCMTDKKQDSKSVFKILEEKSNKAFKEFECIAKDLEVYFLNLERKYFPSKE